MIQILQLVISQFMEIWLPWPFMINAIQAVKSSFSPCTQWSIFRMCRQFCKWGSERHKLCPLKKHHLFVLKSLPALFNDIAVLYLDHFFVWMFYLKIKNYNNIILETWFVILCKKCVIPNNLCNYLNLNSISHSIVKN
jgi:hypothetical protein